MTGKYSQVGARALSAGRRPLALLLLLAVAAILPVPAAAQTAGLAGIEERWGIHIESLRRTAGGLMLDFRYRVLDAGKAAALFRRQTRPYLVDQASGARLLVPSPPKIGPLRSSNPPEEGRVYWMFFNNPGGLIQPGSKVTVVIGDFRAENLTVE